MTHLSRLSTNRPIFGHLWNCGCAARTRRRLLMGTSGNQAGQSPESKVEGAQLPMGMLPSIFNWFCDLKPSIVALENHLVVFSANCGRFPSSALFKYRYFNKTTSTVLQASRQDCQMTSGTVWNHAEYSSYGTPWKNRKINRNTRWTNLHKL